MLSPLRILRSSYQAASGAIVATWWGPTRNWGDALNPILISWLSGRPVVRINDARIYPRPTAIYSVVGSIVQNIAHDAVVVWGSGMIDGGISLLKHPAEVRAVRGLLTRQALQSQGISVPPVYGDPALLLPLIYKTVARTPKKHRLGVIPHMTDKELPSVTSLASQQGVKVIDIFSPTYEFIDQIVDCEAIASSSLHGLIAADAYGIPNVWIECSDRVIGKGFKFRDYFSSVGRQVHAPVRLAEDTSSTELLAACAWSPLQVDVSALIETCPFMPSHRKAAMITDAKSLGIFGV